MSPVSKFLEPPFAEDLRQRAPAECRVLPAGAVLWRVYRRSGTYPSTWDAFREWGPSATARFDHHGEPPCAQSRGIVYLAQHGPTCLAEVFQDTRVVDRRHADPWLVALALTRPVALLDLGGAWPTRAGASMAIASGPRDRSRRWARAIDDAFPQVEGLAYGSSMDANRTAIALFERARDAMPTHPVFHRALSDPGLAGTLRAACVRFSYALV